MTMISRKSHKTAPALTFATAGAEDLSLPYNRTNEVCGPARRSLALMIASLMPGPILWIKPQWNRQDLNAQGLVRLLNPGRITFVDPKRADDVLWCMEEVLRSGCVPTVIAECDTPPTLTPIRRLHLAAEHGAQLRKVKLLSLLLSPADGGAQGVETRWHMSPRHDQHHSRWLVERRRARMSPPAAWTLEWHKTKAKAFALTQVQNIAAQ